MASFLAALPKPKGLYSDTPAVVDTSVAATGTFKEPPPYRKRDGYVPRRNVNPAVFVAITLPDRFRPTCALANLSERSHARASRFARPWITNRKIHGPRDGICTSLGPLHFREPY